jgi:hypothetical protein
MRLTKLDFGNDHKQFQPVLALGSRDSSPEVFEPMDQK